MASEIDHLNQNSPKDWPKPLSDASQRLGEAMDAPNQVRANTAHLAMIPATTTAMLKQLQQHVQKLSRAVTQALKNPAANTEDSESLSAAASTGTNNPSELDSPSSDDDVDDGNGTADAIGDDSAVASGGAPVLNFVKVSKISDISNSDLTKV